MVIFPNCKINIGLNIVRKRTDGYHDLETIFYPVPIYDVLEIIIANHGNDSFVQTGLSIEGPAENNLCIKALKLLRGDFPKLPSVNMHLHKTIPMGAGLGGGSSDGAHTLLLLNKKFNLGLGNAKLIELALQLGSDCPFFIMNKPCFASSRGEMLEPVGMPMLKGCILLLMNPGIHVSTKWAFSQISPAPRGFNLSDIPGLGKDAWKDFVTNDFQQPVAKEFPIIQQLIDTCYSQGAFYAAMSGSGSTCYAFFEHGATIPDFAANKNIWTRQIELS